MKENFSNLVKEIQTTCMSIQVQEAQRVPNKTNAKKLTPRHITIKMPKVKDKERILKAAREKWGVQSIRLSVISKKKKKLLQSRRDWHEKQGPTANCSTQQRCHLESKGR